MVPIERPLAPVNMLSSDIRIRADRPGGMPDVGGQRRTPPSLARGLSEEGPNVAAVAGTSTGVRARDGLRLVYVTHNGIGSALVRSQVLPYLRGLLERGHRIHLVTFERGEPYPEGEFPTEHWSGMRPRRGRSLLAKIIDIVSGAILVRRIARTHGAEAFHARSHVSAAICWLASLGLRKPYVFDMRGFLAEEYLDAGLWASSDVRYRALRLAEGHLLRRASHVVVLTHAAARHMRFEPRYAGAVGGRFVHVIPCAVDLQRFRPSAERDAQPTLVYAGSLGMWYLLDEMLAVYAHARRASSALRFVILNRGEHDLVTRAVQRAGLADAPIELVGADFAEMPRLLGAAHVAIALLRQAPSKIGSSPIKIAEYLACGLPVVVNAGLGDSDALIRAARAGHVMERYDANSRAEAAAAIVRLSADPDARVRARRLAEDTFDVRFGTGEYDRIYLELAGATRQNPQP